MGVLVVVVAQLGELTHLVAHFAVHAQVAIDIDAAIRLDCYGAVILEDDVVGLVAVKRRFAFLYGGAVLAVACNRNDNIAELKEKASFAGLWNADEAEVLHHLPFFELYAVGLAADTAEFSSDILAACHDASEKFHHREPPGWSSRRVRLPFCLSSVNVRRLIR